MPRTIDPMLARMYERSNPNIATFAEVHAPDTGLVLRRGTDQFLGAPLVSQTPASSLASDASGALTLASSALNIASFSTFAGTRDLTTRDSGTLFWGLQWFVTGNFVSPGSDVGRFILRSFSATIEKVGTPSNVDLQLQVYRVVGQAVRTTSGASLIAWTFQELLGSPAIVRYADMVFTGSAATITFDLRGYRLEVGSSNVPAPSIDRTGEQPSYYFVITPTVSDSGTAFYKWRTDAAGAGVINGFGTFGGGAWSRGVNDTNDATKWVSGGVHTPLFSLDAEQYAATSQAVYALALPAAPNAASEGRIVFERGVPPTTSATLELSTAGSGGPWTAATDSDLVAVHQQTYHLRLTLTSEPTLHRVAPRVVAAGINFTIPVDVTAEAIVEPVGQEISVPFLAASIGEGAVTIVRTGRRDYRDVASDLVTSSAVSKLEVETFLGSRHPLAPRSTWLRLDRALVNDRQPVATSERLGLLSYLKLAKRKIPGRTETINETRIVASGATTTNVAVTVALPGAPGVNGYLDKNYYIRVRSSAVAGVATGFVATIANNSGTTGLVFSPALPAAFVAGDVLEIHSAQFVQDKLIWADADPADVWLDIWTDLLAVPLERIGRSDLGTSSKSGMPPHVTDRAPGDPTTQAKLLVTIEIAAPEIAKDLIDQLSFIMGGATVEIGGQIVFRQIYPLRDPNGAIVIPAEPIAATFDVRNTSNLETPVGLEQRITQLACDFGVNLTAVSSDETPSQTSVFADLDALDWLDDQEVDELAPAAIPAEIARWCYNSADTGELLAGMLTQQVVRAGSTGLRLWSWTGTEPTPQLVAGDRVTVITDQYTDYDPARKLQIRGWYAYPLVLVSVKARQFRGYMLGLTEAVQVRGGPGVLAPTKSGPLTERIERVSDTPTTLTVNVYVADAHPDGGGIEIDAIAEGVASVTPTTATLTPPTDVITDDVTTTAHKTFIITKSPPGSPQGRVTFVATNAHGVTTTASVDVLAAGASSLAMRIHQRDASDESLELDVYVADTAADATAPITVQARGFGVASVLADDGTQVAIVGSRGNLIPQSRNMAGDRWVNRTVSAVSFDATIAGPDGTLGVSKLVASATGQYTGVQIGTGDWRGVTVTIGAWLRATTPTTVRISTLREGDSENGGVLDVAVTTSWQYFESTMVLAFSSATSTLSYFVQVLGVASTVYVWETRTVRGAIAAVTDDLDTTDYVRFLIARADKQTTATNYVLESDSLDTSGWVLDAGVTATPNVVTYAGHTFARIAQTAPATANATQALALPRDGVYTVSAWFHHDGHVGSSMQALFDATASITLARWIVDYNADGSIAITPVVGALTRTDEVDGVVRVDVPSVALDHTHSIQLYALGIGAAGLGAAGVTSQLESGWMVVEGARPFPSAITTTTQPTTLTVENAAGAVALTATRGGETPTSQTIVVPPRGTLPASAATFAVEGEATSRDGAGDGQVRLIATFDGRTESMDVYTSESAASAGATPASDHTALSGTIARHEGVIASDENWTTEYDIATTPGWYRQIAVALVQPGGSGKNLQFRLPLFKYFEQLATDVGAGPASAPSGTVVTFSTVGGVPRATISFAGDAGSSHRIMRNGYWLTRLAPGNVAFVDDGLTVGTDYKYRIQAVKNGQTSDFDGGGGVGGGGGGGGTGGGTPTGTAETPGWATGYPFGGSAPLFAGNPSYVNVSVVNPDASASTEVWMSPSNADAGPWIAVGEIGPGSTSLTLYGDDWGIAYGETRYFYLVGTRPGWTDSADSTHKPASFFGDP